MNDITLRDALVKPDGILKMIAEKFDFEMGVPKREFSGRVSQTTKMDFLFNDNRYPASCTLSIDGYPFPDTPAYVYEYMGPIVDNGIIMEGKHYLAYVLNKTEGFVGQSKTPMVIPVVIGNARGIITAPKWFPLGK